MSSWSAAVAGEIIRRALALNVIDPEDVTATGVATDDPPNVLEKLIELRTVTREIAASLAKLIELRPLARALAGEDVLLDLLALEPQQRLPIEQAAFKRVALRIGAVDRATLQKFGDSDERIEDLLVAKGVIDRATAMKIFTLQASRLACGSCFKVLNPDATNTPHCPFCGRKRLASGGARVGSTTSGRSAVPSTGMGTAAPERGPTGTRIPNATASLPTSHGIEGFPGVGGVFAGHELLERVAEGGMGVVFRARQLRLNRIVALKVMRGGSLANQETRRRFVYEAEAVAALKHPSIVVIHEIDEVAGYPFYTMDFVEGPPVSRHVRDGKSTPREVAAIVRSIADAVQHFHLRGVIHRDLKPDNILVDPAGVPKIIDFGIAKKLGDNQSNTREGEVVGTLRYMSPEQAAGRIQEIDTRSDVYALGAILWELLAGEPLWSGMNEANMLRAIETEDAPSLRRKRPSLDIDLDAIVQKALAKERERRYQSAHELAADLDRYARHMPVIARPATFGYRLRKAVRRRLPVVIMAGVTVVTLLSVASWAAVRAWQRKVELDGLVRDASAATEVDKQIELLKKVQDRDPENPAVAQLANLEKNRDRIKENEKRELERQSREKAESESKQRRLAERRDTATRLLATAAATADALQALDPLEKALALYLPGEEDEVVPKLQAAAATRLLVLAKEELDGNRARQAEYWLVKAKTLPAAAGRASDVAALERRLARLKSGQQEIEEARRLVHDQKWLAARAALAQAREQGFPDADLKPLEATVHAACAQIARDLIVKAHEHVQAGELVVALGETRQAAEFEPGSGETEKLERSCEAIYVRDVQREAASLWTRGEATRALQLLRQAIANVRLGDDPGLLKREFDARTRLAEERALENLVYVPELAEYAAGGFYIQRTEVTNEEFDAFVRAGGYANQKLWDAEGLKVLPRLRDGCQDRACEHRAPRTWIGGRYGDERNAKRPVRGVTIHEARAFARWRAREGAPWRLPKAPEWEIAASWDPDMNAGLARPGRLRKFPWGDVFENGKLALGLDVPPPVGSNASDVSALGIHDLGGSVVEWVDRPNEKRPGAKGAHFAAHEAFARTYSVATATAIPHPDAPDTSLDWTGFRLVLGANAPP